MDETDDFIAEAIRLLDGGAHKWKARAACRNQDTALFFPEWSHGKRLALRFCEKCPVTKECRQYADEFERAVGWESGIYGGTVPAERKLENVQWRKSRGATVQTDPT